MRAVTTCVVLVAALLSWVAPRVLTYVCSMDGVARSQCCCAPRGEAPSDARQAEAEGADCCKVNSDDVVTAATVSPSDRMLLAAQIVPEVPLRSLGPDGREQLRMHPPRGPPRGIGPPSYLRCCVLLI